MTVGAFIEGFVRGQNVRHSWEDRKRANARADELFEMRKADRDREIGRQDVADGRAAERHEAWKNDLAFTRSERERVAARRAREEGREDALMKAFEESVDGPPAPPPGAAPPRYAMPVTTPSPVEPQVAQVARAETVPPVEPEVIEGEVLPVDGLYEPDRRGRRPVLEQSPSQTWREHGRRVADFWRRPSERAIAGMEFAPSSAPAPTEPVNQAPLRDARPAAQPSTPREAAVQAGAAAAQTPSAAQIAEVVAPRDAGNAAPYRPTPKARERAGKAGMAHWLTNGAPVVQRELLRQGRIAEAQQLQSMIDSQEVKEGIEAYSRMIFSASIGDWDGFEEEAVYLYNKSGYLDDGQEIDTQKSGFVRDDNGNLIGAEIVIKTADGKSFTQTLDESQMIELAVTQLGPERQLEMHLAKVQSAREIDADTLNWQREIETLVIKKALEGGGGRERADRISKRVSEMLENSLTQPTEEQLDEMVRLATQLEDRLYGASGPGVAGVPRSPSIEEMR